uniref:G protein-coupled receptor n=1 Tax=Caenorhabditis tropicalis TaxID=1561998 RepID=A0A1I7T3Y5_9PELO
MGVNLVFLPIQGFLFVATIMSNWRVIRTSVMSKFRMKVDLLLLLFILGGYICTTIVNVAIVLTQLFLFPNTEAVFTYIDTTIEFIIYFAKFIFFLELTGDYKRFFGKYESCIFPLLCILGALISFVIPEFISRIFGDTPSSHLISFGFSSINFLFNIFLLIHKLENEKNTSEDVEDVEVVHTTRRRAIKASELMKSMLAVSTSRFFICLIWVIFQFFFSTFSTDVQIIAYGTFHALRSFEGVTYGVAFEKSLDKHIRSSHIAGRPIDSEFYQITKEERRIRESREAMISSWEKASREMARISGRRKQDAPTTSDQALIPEEDTVEE